MRSRWRQMPQRLHQPPHRQLLSASCVDTLRRRRERRPTASADPTSAVAKPELSATPATAAPTTAAAEVQASCDFSRLPPRPGWSPATSRPRPPHPMRGTGRSSVPAGRLRGRRYRRRWPHRSSGRCTPIGPVMVAGTCSSRSNPRSVGRSAGCWRGTTGGRSRSALAPMSDE